MVAAVLESGQSGTRGLITLKSMLNAAAAGAAVSRKQYTRWRDRFRVELVNAQFDLRRAKKSVVILIAGDDRIGINEVVHLLHEWMDARYIDTRIAFGPTEEERQRPPFWRFWRDLASRGRIGLYVGGWAAEPIRQRLAGRLDAAGFAGYLGHASRFEQTLAADGALILKFWLHLPRKELKRRVAGEREDEESGWQIHDSDQAVLDAWRRWTPLVEKLLATTDSPAARWHVVDGSTDRSRNVAVARTILAGLDKFLSREKEPRAGKMQRKPVRRFPDALGAVDLAARFKDDETYEAALNEQQASLAVLSRAARSARLSTVLVFEGWDAAGKGGAIRRVTQALEVRDYHVVPIAAPTPREQDYHYLWRFWQHLPAASQMTIFDRSWYGRVLVERVERFAAPAEWERAYSEIVDFENQLLERGTVLLKFWLHIDNKTQLARFAAREKTPYKKYRIGADDYRNRARRADYLAAANEMVARTGTRLAPWHLVPANDKRHARVAVLTELCRVLREALQARP